MPVTNKKIGVIMGGTSAEREISIKSGTAVFNALRGLGCDAVSLDAGNGICEALKKENIEVAFLILHGGCGEDGSIQGLLEVLGIPYTGSGVLASALAMDKEASKKVFVYHGIPVAPFLVLQSADFGNGDARENKLKALCSRLRAGFEMPWVVKPATEGSSIGVSIVRDESSLSPAVEKAFGFGRRAVIEKYIKGREIQVGILNNRVLGSVEVRPKSEFYSYEAKYIAGLTEYILPPEVGPEALRKAEATALSAHTALDCRGATRVDLILDGECNPYVLEVNTIPGMTETSLLPKIAGLSGLDFPALLEEILREALMRGGRG
ncbi:MAG: D-alanine--D-alanine ligase [Nitrospirae bacterium]|nr:D-alanine--D-alanine ligase [Nitrospirota bacterium]